MRKWEIVPVWIRILQGYRPFLSIEITRECPLHCPGCYAYDENHLNNGKPLRQASEFRGKELVEGVLDLVRRHHPVHISVVGGEPLLRQEELDILLPRFNAMGIEVQLVTSAVRPIPISWNRLSNLHLAVSVDGLPPEHDRRRFPADYGRILRNIKGHKVNVHCVILPSMLTRPDYLKDFAAFWSSFRETGKIWFSLYTPQQDENSEERLIPEERTRAVNVIARLKKDFNKVQAPGIILDGYRHPPPSPQDCIFAQTTACLSPDLKTPVTPCQIGGRPVCSECGCFAAAALASVARFKLAGFLKLGDMFRMSQRIGCKLHPERVQFSYQMPSVSRHPKTEKVLPY
ncbi:MAG: radical SAM protein [Acidobacteria bacterium]|nr:radical SAM protein [Acidobacteriota bacterium]